jgi:hypothetical protein
LTLTNRTQTYIGSAIEAARRCVVGHDVSLGNEWVTEGADRSTALALGELRGLLAAFAWANHKCNHFCTFTVEELVAGADIHEALSRYFGESASQVSVTPLGDWPAAVGEALHRWLFQFGDLVKAEAVCALTDERTQREMVDTVLDAFRAGLQPLKMWRVEIEPRGFYECTWDDFAVRGSSGLFLLHLGVSD